MLVVRCLNCGHFIPKLENDAMRYAMSCPTCNRPVTFGPVFIEGFEGYPIEEAERMRPLIFDKFPKR